jgi:hypothetical protein
VTCLKALFQHFPEGLGITTKSSDLLFIILVIFYIGMTLLSLIVDIHRPVGFLLLLLLI